LLLHHTQIEDYLGIDVIPPYIEWDSRFISPLTDGRFRFAHLDVRGPRYNPEGTISAEEVVFPAADGSMTLAFAASLFTHLKEAATIRYLQEARRVLKRGGKLIASIHDRPDDGSKFSGDEFRADVQPEYFLALAERSGFELARRVGDVCGQETFVLLAR
jgi:SAM-dependent methyltransferase